MSIADSETLTLGVDYDEFHPESYRGVALWGWDGERPQKLRDFASGTARDDYRGAIDWAADRGVRVLKLSSVDHFISDGGDLV